jgi:hypothetical protein
MAPQIAKMCSLAATVDRKLQGYAAIAMAILSVSSDTEQSVIKDCEPGLELIA